MSNTTSTGAPQATTTPASPTSSDPSSPSANSDTSTATTPTLTSSTPTTLPTSSTPAPTSSTPTTSSPPPPTSSTPTTAPTSPTPSIIVTTSLVPSDGSTSTIVTTITSTQDTSTPSQTTSASGTNTSSGAAVGPTDSSSGGLSSSGKIAIAVVVPIAAVALLVLAGIFLWRKRKQRKDAEEQRRKEVEDYTYNPNADPTIPPVAGGGFAMKEDAPSGYRGWGSTTLAGSTGRKASTTMSGGAAGGAYSDATSPTRGGISDTRSGEPMMNDGTHSPEGEILGAMGPPAANNRSGDIHRGPSNASSSYSAAARSDGSGEGGIGVAYGDPNYYNQYGTNNPYAENAYGSPPRPSELAGAPVIRDNPARRNTRIENPAHYPQNAGISQNF